MEDKIIDEKEVARILGVSVQLLRNNRCKGIGVPYVKVSPGKRGTVRYIMTDVVNYIKNHRINTAR